MNQHDDDELLFDEEDDLAFSSFEDQPYQPDFSPWPVLVVDDEPEVHTITRMVLMEMTYNDRKIEMISSYSAAEALQILQTRPMIAVILLDVVMETDDAGLQLVRRIREDLGNHQTRIVLRTGQPGQAPERRVIVDYDINDYKSKADLSAQQLFTTTMVALRSYDYINIIETNRRGLEKIIHASSSLFRRQSLKLFASGILTQLSALLEVSDEAILCVRWGRNESQDPPTPYILAGSGQYEAVINQPLHQNVDQEIEDVLTATISARKNLYTKDYTTLFLQDMGQGVRGRDIVIYLKTGKPLREIDQRLVEVFCDKISVGFDNIYIAEQLKLAQKATVVALADLAEYKDTDTGEHVLRVADITEAITKELRRRNHFTDEIDDLFVEYVPMASMLHDVGKVSTPDAILKKPGSLNDDEWKIMKKHTVIGGEILRRADQLVDGRSYLTYGAQVAECHHEHYDGKGSPHGLVGNTIPLAARIVAVADVFDALISQRPYKKPWPKEKAITFIQERSGKQFDPIIVDAFVTVVQPTDQTN